MAVIQQLRIARVTDDEDFENLGEVGGDVLVVNEETGKVYLGSGLSYMELGGVSLGERTNVPWHKPQQAKPAPPHSKVPEPKK